MTMSGPKFNNINEYIAGFPRDTQKILEQLRTIIRESAPHAEEVISYRMPAFKQNEVLVYFAGYKNHIGFYPTSSGIKAFQSELSEYKYSKGAVQFPIDKQLPAGLISEIVKFRVLETLEKENNKITKK